MVKETFATRITELRKSRNISQQQLADGIGITRQSLGRYESSERTADIEILARIAEYFNVSTDYLLGRADEPFADPDDAAICKKLGIGWETLEALQSILVGTPEEWNYDPKDINMSDIIGDLMHISREDRRDAREVFSMFIEGIEEESVQNGRYSFLSALCEYRKACERIIDAYNGDDNTEWQYYELQKKAEEADTQELWDELAELEGEFEERRKKNEQRDRELKFAEWQVSQCVGSILERIADRIEDSKWQA